ncbi:MAG: AarF/ABC1/UbiB kinase family protein [Bacteroidales bacterium]|nr:AarF/ABC1/UbiB kinase family protein [Bacteroidales bacterium]
MKEQISIPTGKVQRASRFLTTGVKVGGNYLKHYARKSMNGDTGKDQLHTDNARDIYETLSELKGSALKAAQMMSMDRNMLPRAYSDKFAMAQYSAPPLSYPLVVKTFRSAFGKSPSEVFDSFSHNAVNAASIGQVHKADLKGKKLAVKVQYPGVADSVSSDLKLVKPFALRLMNITESDFKLYMSEVEERLLEETDYRLELQRSVSISEAVLKEGIQGIYFPVYYPELSGNRIITMDWLEGMHLREFLETNPDQQVRNRIGQTLWNFYDFQMHKLRMVHADPHPGNFLFRSDGSIGIIDFGCVKVVPDDFYENYFRLHTPGVMENEELMTELFYLNEFITERDSEDDKRLFIPLFRQIIGLMGKPFFAGEFDFGDDEFFKSIYSLSESLYNNKDIRNSRTARGSKHSLYINRTYFGLYMLLHELRSSIVTISNYRA